MTFDALTRRVSDYFSRKITAEGNTPRGVDWNSTEAQVIRLEQLLKVCDRDRMESINDYGCGYGALLDLIRPRFPDVDYRGFDVAEAMIDAARAAHSGRDRESFFCDPSRLSPAEYTVASGIFNIRASDTDQQWREYVLHCLDVFRGISTRGFSFNMLTKYSDQDRMRPDLYYADPCFVFDYCKRRFSRNVALLHDYDIYDFTVIVRLQPGVLPRADAGSVRGP